MKAYADESYKTESELSNLVSERSQKKVKQDDPLYLAIDHSGNLWFTTSADPAQIGVVYLGQRVGKLLLRPGGG